MCVGSKFAEYFPDGPPVLYVLTHEREHTCFLVGIQFVETEQIYDRRAPQYAQQYLHRPPFKQVWTIRPLAEG